MTEGLTPGDAGCATCVMSGPFHPAVDMLSAGRVFPASGMFPPVLKTPLNLFTPAIQSPVYAVARHVQAMLNTIALPIQSFGQGVVPVCPGPVGQSVKVPVNAFTFPVQV